jgi:hypothetical protein
MNSEIDHSVSKNDLPKALFEALFTGMIMSGLILLMNAASERAAVGAILISVAVFMIWRVLTQQLDRIESKLSN